MPSISSYKYIQLHLGPRSHVHTTYSPIPKYSKLLTWPHGTEIGALNEYTNFLHFHSLQGNDV